MRSDLLIAGIILMILTSAISCADNIKPEESDEKDRVNIRLTDFMMGVDLSYVNQVEEHGGIYKVKGEVADPFDVFAENGANIVRLRLWHNPSWVKDLYGEDTEVYSGFEEVAKGIKRAKENGMAVNLDFHYSDVWADPSTQDVPEAWKEITDLTVLCDSVYNYTYKVLHTLYTRNLLPEMVQIGNESNCGMMITETTTGFPDLNVCNGNWANMGRVLNAGIKAVRDMDEIAGQHTIIALHVADPKNLDWWFTSVMTEGGVTDFDIAGFSYYYIWHTEVSFNELPSVVKSLKSKINKDVVILETAYAYTNANGDDYGNIFYDQEPIEGYPFTVDGQRQYMIDLVQNMVDAGALGVMYWEPAWITSNMRDLWGTGSSWENCALFNFSGNVTDAIEYLNYDYGIGQ